MMTVELFNSTLLLPYNRKKIVLFIIFFLITATISIDYVEAVLGRQLFFFSESLLFSTFWLLFLPLLKVQWACLQYKQSMVTGLFLSGLLIVVHLSIYPVLVFLVSKGFYQFTFSYSQVFRFGISTHFFDTALMYLLSISCFFIFHSYRFQSSPALPAVPDIAKPFLSSLIVADAHGEKRSIATEEVLYFMAAAPYVAIFHQSKKYLYSETLKALVAQLANNRFVRVHKSCILNIRYVISYKSRLNGDYDATLLNGTILRVSRNYASAFKQLYESYHQVSTK